MTHALLLLGVFLAGLVAGAVALTVWAMWIVQARQAQAQARAARTAGLRALLRAAHDARVRETRHD